MKNLSIASWNLKNNLFDLKKDEYKVSKILEFINDKDIDILALQNVNRKLGLKINEEIKKMGYHFDHINEESYTMLDRMIGKEKNPIIIKNNFLNISDVAEVKGLLINKVYITDEKNLNDKFCVVNTTLNNIDSSRIDFLAHYIDTDKLQIERKSPIIVTGRFNFDINSMEMTRLRKEALNKNNIHVYGNFKYKNEEDYMMLNDFDVEDCGSYNEYALTDMSKPIMAKVKMK